jgi:DNA polymerase-3 subunit beta
MRFTLSSNELNAQLQTLSKVINSKNSLPILDCFLFEVANSKMTITASDNENVMRTSIALENADSEGKFAISNHIILDAMRELPEQPLTFDVDTEALTVKVLYQNGNGKFDFTAMNANEYPQIKPIGDGASVITINSAILNDNISRSIFATAQDELRPVMNGIYFDLTTDALAIVASDGHKLVRNKNYTVKSDTPASFILPKKPANLLKNVLAKDGGDVVIKFDSRNAEITYGEGTLSCRLIEGRYPNYNSVIPQDNPNKMTIDRRTLLSALRRVLPFASGTQLIRFHLETGKLELRSEDIDFATSAQEKLTCDYSGRPINIGFKGGSLTEILNNLDCEEVTLELSDPSRAGVIVPTTQDKEEEVLMLIMPMLLND